MRKPTPDGTGQTEVVLEPVAFLRRLAVLVPPARQNQVGYDSTTACWPPRRATATAASPSFRTPVAMAVPLFPPARATSIVDCEAASSFSNSPSPRHGL